jgi:hypothetical protein
LPRELWAQEDVNTPWDPNTHLVAYPHRFRLTAESINLDEPEVVWVPSFGKMEFFGQVAVADANGLIGLSTVPEDILVWDDLGNPIEGIADSRSTLGYLPPLYVATLRVPGDERILEVMPYNFSIDMQVDQADSFPLALSRLEWSLGALLGETFELIDVPFATTEDWIEVVPGLEIMVEEAIVEAGRYEYSMKSQFRPSDVAHPDYRAVSSRNENGYTWLGKATPGVAVAAMEIVDANGNSVHYQGSGGGITSTVRSTQASVDRATVTRIERSTCSACGEAAFFRYTIAWEPYEQEVRFVLEDVPVPGF